MDGESLVKLCVVLENQDRGYKPPWSEGAMLLYEIGLRDIPNDAAVVLSKAIVDHCPVRPSVSTIVDLWRQIAGIPRRCPELVAAELLRRNRELGPAAAPHPLFPGQRNLRELGPPPDLSETERRIVDAMGGWVALYHDDTPIGVKRAHMTKIAQALQAAPGDETINRLRLEYQETRAAMQPGIEEVPEADPDDA